MTEGYVPWAIKVPGRFLDAVAYLDIETRKVPCRWAFPDGTPLRRRWSAFMVGVATAGQITIVESVENERALLTGAREAIGKADTVLYLGSRKFDEMILKGRFTYARRGPAPEPFYPAMPDAEELTWDQYRTLPEPWRSLRERELDSRYVPEVYAREPDLVLIHNLRDVVWLVAAYGEPDEECEAWCRKVLTDRMFADSVLYGD
jgi:hypothetical protein